MRPSPRPFLFCFACVLLACLAALLGARLALGDPLVGTPAHAGASAPVR